MLQQHLPLPVLKSHSHAPQHHSILLREKRNSNYVCFMQMKLYFDLHCQVCTRLYWQHSESTTTIVTECVLLRQSPRETFMNTKAESTRWEWEQQEIGKQHHTLDPENNKDTNTLIISNSLCMHNFWAWVACQMRVLPAYTLPPELCVYKVLAFRVFKGRHTAS